MSKHTAETIRLVLKDRILNLDYPPEHRFTEKALYEELWSGIPKK